MPSRKPSLLTIGSPLFARLKEDIEAFRAHDPAATSTVSILLNSPGMRAIWAYRRQHWLWTHGHRLLARCLSTLSRHRFGVEIHPGATIGRRFIIDHGMGIVIGETCIIGDDCMVYQGVTLGGTGKQTGKRHPTLGDRVTVGVGAAVLGDITLGNDSKVGGGAVVVKDVPEGCTVVGIPGHITTRCGVRVHRGAAANDGRRRSYLPDPVEQTMDILSARITQLEEEVAELRAQSPQPPTKLETSKTTLRQSGSAAAPLADAVLSQTAQKPKAQANDADASKE